MDFITKFLDTKDPAFSLRITATVLVSLCLIITLAALCFAYQVSAAGVDSIDHFLTTEPADSQPLPDVTEPVQTETVPPTTAEPPSAEVIALQESLAAAETERDALHAQLADATAAAAQLQEDLDALREELGTVYTLRIRLERNTSFPGTSEVITFIRSVDLETYELWEPGDVITEYDGFLSLPDGSLFHSWTVILEDKYITGETA